jgi:hypothetical protein
MEVFTNVGNVKSSLWDKIYKSSKRMICVTCASSKRQILSRN